MTFVFALIWFGSLLIDSLVGGKSEKKTVTGNPPPKIKIAKELFEEKILQKISERNTEILRRVWEKSKPEIERLKRETLDDIEKHTLKVLNGYFSISKRKGVENFLNWLYSFGTDYIVVFKKVMDTKSKVQCLINLKSGKVETLSECAKNSELERYVLQKVKIYLVNDKEISHLIEEKVIPYANRRVEEFKKNTLQIVRQKYQEELLKESKKISARLVQKGELKDLTEEDIEEVTQKVNRELTSQVLGDVTKRISAKVGVLITSAIVVKIATETTQKVAIKLAEKITVKVTAKVLTKLAEKLGAKALSALGGFESGVLACSWAGPFSIACGVAGGMVAWVATDWAINKLDEVLNREEMRKELINLLSEGERYLANSVVDTYKKALNRWENALMETLWREMGNLKLKEVPKILNGNL